MGKIYIGVGHLGSGGSDVYVAKLGKYFPLKHRYPSPAGFQWGWHGAGLADLAVSILWDVLGEEPPPILYQHFRQDFIVKWPMHNGECWRISEDEIKRWIAKQKVY